jgi:tetratricopeptide (TPR) repeat protein
MSEFQHSQDFHLALNESARLLRQNRPGEAILKLEPLYKQAPDHPDVAINLSGAYILQRKWNKAVGVLSKAVKTNPDNAMLWTNMGAAQLGPLETAGPRQQEKAIKAYYQALRADSEAPNVHYHLGLIYKERGELMRASAMFQRAVEVNSADTDAQYWLDQLGREIAEELHKNEEDDTRNSGADDGGTEAYRRDGQNGDRL